MFLSTIVNAKMPEFPLRVNYLNAFFQPRMYYFNANSSVCEFDTQVVLKYILLLNFLSETKKADLHNTIFFFFFIMSGAESTHHHRQNPLSWGNRIDDTAVLHTCFFHYLLPSPSRFVVPVASYASSPFSVALLGSSIVGWSIFFKIYRQNWLE